MELLTTKHRRRLLANGRWNNARALRGTEPEDFQPVAKLFCPWSAATWLLTELDPEDHDLAFGLCDLGMGFPEIGRVRLSELEAISGPGGLRIERDRSFKPTQTLQGYAEEARRKGRVVA
jgi:hypothetical protein